MQKEKDMNNINMTNNGNYKNNAIYKVPPSQLPQFSNNLKT